MGWVSHFFHLTPAAAASAPSAPTATGFAAVASFAFAAAASAATSTVIGGPFPPIIADQDGRCGSLSQQPRTWMSDEHCSRLSAAGGVVTRGSPFTRDAVERSQVLCFIACLFCWF